MNNPIHYIPIFTTIIAVFFSLKMWKHWRQKPEALYLFWWFIGVVAFGLGTLVESLTTLFGWNVIVFKMWYISGALLGGAPLALGTVYLLMNDSAAHRWMVAVISLIIIASICVSLSPILYEQVEMTRLSGKVLQWQWVRLFSPFINGFAFIFLVGGAAWSAWKYWKLGDKFKNRFSGNVFIAIGGLLPGIGGASARADFVEILYITEFIGLICIWLGYWIIARDHKISLHKKQA
ncbi:MAG: hypothetical protein DWQ05_07785 [Calditrichaeota bacterium]|nr:MAG: hypothetical protein DWQ05_07785 [Calditrichota bacterium]